MKVIKVDEHGVSDLVREFHTERPNLDQYRSTVRTILEDVRSKGDDAMRRLTARYDGVQIDELEVPARIRQEAEDALHPELRSSLQTARRNLIRFHRSQLPDSKRVDFEGIYCWTEVRPLQSVGLYVPAGSAPLISTVLMLAVPARLAGVGELILCTPPGKDGLIDKDLLAACSLAGIDRVFRCGGAQAIAALAFGTETIPSVDKIFGPGSTWVTAAKAEISIHSQGCAIDMLAGPSELAILADKDATPEFVAADLLSQAEHDENARLLLLSTSQELIPQCLTVLDRQMASLPRREIAESALRRGRAVLVQGLETACRLINAFAPEHLSLQVQKPRELLPLVQNAGSVFLGTFSAEALGDYCSGPNHVLPTGGGARHRGGLNVLDFMKFITVQEVQKTGLRRLGPVAIHLARAEGLEGHARAVLTRLSHGGS